MYIERNPLKNFSMPSLIGRRLTVHNIVSQLFLEQNVDTVLQYYEISIEQLKSTLEYCCELTCKTDCITCKFCDGCRLRILQDGEHFEHRNYIEIMDEKGFPIVKSLIDGSIYLGNLHEFEKDFVGDYTWETSKKLLDTFFGSV